MSAAPESRHSTTISSPPRRTLLVTSLQNGPLSRPRAVEVRMQHIPYASGFIQHCLMRFIHNCTYGWFIIIFNFFAMLEIEPRASACQASSLPLSHILTARVWYPLYQHRHPPLVTIIHQDASKQRINNQSPLPKLNV